MGNKGHWANTWYFLGKRKHSHCSSYDQDNISNNEGKEDADPKQCFIMLSKPEMNSTFLGWEKGIERSVVAAESQQHGKG